MRVPRDRLRPKAVLRHTVGGPLAYLDVVQSCLPHHLRDILCGLLKSGKVKIAVGCPHCLHVRKGFCRVDVGQQQLQQVSDRTRARGAGVVSRDRVFGGGEGGWRWRGKRSRRRGRIGGAPAGAGLSPNQTDTYQQEQSELFFRLNFHELALSGSSLFNATSSLNSIFKIRIDGGWATSGDLSAMCR